jgi:hypothetical protein
MGASAPRATASGLPSSLAPVQWLAHDFTGVRSPAEAQRDVLAIAHATAPLNEAHVSVDPDDGESPRVTGHVTSEPRGAGPLTICGVDGTPVFEFDLHACRGAWLSTFDGGDYYGLQHRPRLGLRPALRRLQRPVSALPKLGRRGFRDWSELVADLAAIQAAPAPLNRARVWHYDPAIGGVAPTGRLAVVGPPPPSSTSRSTAPTSSPWTDHPCAAAGSGSARTATTTWTWTSASAATPFR